MSELGQGRRSRGAVKGSALPQKADQPLLQSMISSVPDSDVAGPKILAYSRVRSVAAVRSLRRAVWSTLGLAGEQAWICAIVTTFMIFGVWPSGECPVRSSIISTAPRTRRQHTGATRKPSKAATLYPASCAGLGALIFQSPPWARSSRCRSIALPLPCSACSTIRVNVPSRPRLRNMAMFGVSSLGTVSLEELRKAHDTSPIYQFYFHKDRGLNRAMLQRAKDARIDIMMLTVDSITGG